MPKNSSGGSGAKKAKSTIRQYYSINIKKLCEQHAALVRVHYNRLEFYLNRRQHR